MGFGNLFKKELKQLLTRQALFSMIFTMFLYMFLGKVMGNTMNKIENSADDGGKITLVNLDTGDFTKKMLDDFRAEGKEIILLPFTGTDEDYSSVFEGNDKNTMLIIPEGFSDDVTGGKCATLKLVTKINGTGLANLVDSVQDGGITEKIENYVKNYAQTEHFKLTKEQIELSDKPSTIVDFTVANGRTAKIAPSAVSGVLMALSTVMPIAIFFLLMMASQMVMTAISTEKIDKTLETLLSSPVSRISVLLAKVAAAIVVALLNAVCTMIGFSFYLNGMTGGRMMNMVSNPTPTMSPEITNAAADMTSTDAVSALAQLGVGLTGGQIFLIFLELFIGLAIGLCISLIVGAMATDAQSLSTLLMPIMIVVMLPFFVTMFMDVNQMNIVGKLVMYAVPFTHTYTALTNLIFHHNAALWGGLAYQLVFLAATMYAAVKVFTTDLLFTMKLPEKSAATKKSSLFGNK